MDDKELYDAITNVDEGLLDRSLEPHGKRRPGKWVIPVVAVLVLIAVSAAVVFALWRRPETPAPALPESSTGPARTDDPGQTVVVDRVYTASPVEAPVQWESEKGLTLLSAVNGSGEIQTDLAVRYPEYMLLSADGVSAVSRSVTVSVLSGVKISRTLSGRFSELTFKPDSQTGFDTSEFGDFEGTFYDLANGELICIGYEVAKLVNADREDEIEEIFLMLSSQHIVNQQRTVSDEAIEQMYRLYADNVNQYEGNYPGWRGLCSDFPEITAAHFGWTEEQYGLLYTYFQTGHTDLDALCATLGVDYTAQMLQSRLDQSRNAALHDGVGQVHVLHFQGDGRYAFVTRIEKKTVSTNVSVQMGYALLYDREQKTMTLLCGPNDKFSAFNFQRGDCVLDPDAKVAGFLAADTFDRNRGLVHLYDSEGNHRIIGEGVDYLDGYARKNYNLSLSGSILLSPSGRYACCRIKSDDEHPTERWILFAFSASDKELPVVIEGTFVRFGRDDSVAICRVDGGYAFYSTQTGRDVTELFAGEEGLPLAAHEYYDLTETQEGLFRVHILTGEAELLAQSGTYEAYETDPSFSCVYLVSIARETVDCILLADGLSEYTISIDAAFLNEVGPRDIVSLDGADGGATLILSYFRPASVELDEEKLLERMSKIHKEIGLVSYLSGGFFSGSVLRSIRCGDVYLNFLRGEDPNITSYPLDTMGQCLTLPLIRELVADDMLITEEDILEIAREFAEKVVGYIDIDKDGTVRLAAGAVEELFGIELNIGEAFTWGVWIPFQQSYWNDSEMLDRLADINVRDVLKNDPGLAPGLTEETLASFISLVADRLKQAYASHYLAQEKGYNGVLYADLLLMKDKIRTWTEDWLAEYDVDPETVAERIRTASLTGLSGYVPMTDEEKQAAGIG